MKFVDPGSQPLTGVRIAQAIECDGPGGAERVVAHLVTGLIARGAEVFAYLPQGTEGWLGQQLRESRVTVQQFDISRTFRPGFAGWLSRSMRSHRIDLVHSHEFTFAVHGAWSAWRTGAGHVATIHGGRYWAGAWRRRVLFRMAVGLGGGLAAVSETLRGHLAEDLLLPKDRIKYIPNGVPCEGGGRRELVREELGLTSEMRLALAIGSLYPVKGHRILIEALGALRERHPQLHVAIAGRGGEERALREQVEGLGLTDRVHLLGLRSDVPNLLAAADLFVMPSLNEGLPMALLEAMCASKIVIASSVGAIPAVLKSGELGILVPPGDHAALAEEAVDHVLLEFTDMLQVAGRVRPAACCLSALWPREARAARVAGRQSAVHETLRDPAPLLRDSGRRLPAPQKSSRHTATRRSGAFG